MTDVTDRVLTADSIEEDCCALPGDEVEDCCAMPQTVAEAAPKQPALCPQCGSRGRRVDLITPKSLLRPPALELLAPEELYHFCAQEQCETVYFSDSSRFTVADLKVPVFQKDTAADVSVCYCFGWTRQRIADEISWTGASSAAPRITAHVQAGRCACEVNNPQGSCCLGNVTTTAKQAMTGSVRRLAGAADGR